MGGDYYHACCGDANIDIPEGPKLPFVGDKEPLSALAAEFQSGSPILQEKIKEHILETQDKAEVDRIMKKIEQCKKTLQSLGYIEFTFEDFFSSCCACLGAIMICPLAELSSLVLRYSLSCWKMFCRDMKTSIGPEELLERTRDDNVSDYGLFVTSGEIQRRAEFFEPFISGLTNSTVDQFCKVSVEPMGEESDHVHIIALSDALGVPIRVMYLDRSSCDTGNLSVNHHDFIPPANSSEGDAAMSSTTAAEKPYITLLYRPGHYDILYPK
ncbi:hypothetical protein PR202_ga21609 [Eleusine coracana subsp. coracana]|uniref:Ubiquitinyl hydrolase 1 n=1 Tax=Eleusine coracana subsp. coracana TaxID=191504 RepID=A0AAV5D0Z2_ELECO|nr:hypothetical protein PR202_ga21609 [Eleusine coracana subsp. coracana]